MRPIILFVLITATFQAATARNLQVELDLKGRWLFEIGDNMAYAKPGFDDSDWEKIRVPGCWEDFGFPGYDGFAWYRLRVTLPLELKNKSLFLKLGRIDDVDQVYLNGHFIAGTGSLPPKYTTAFNNRRSYYLPKNLLEFGGNNLIAVRVYDEWGCGGILENDVGIYSDPDEINLRIDLAGNWKFKTGDALNWADIELDDTDWENVMVPSMWRAYGYGDYDGYGWYRKDVVLKNDLRAEKLILVLGKIDDMDEIYFNGVRIGRTGQFPGEKFGNRNNDYYRRDRFYFVPSHLIRWNRKNVIAVRVYDVWSIGGIYEGPIGFTTREEYFKFKKR